MRAVAALGRFLGVAVVDLAFAEVVGVRLWWHARRLRAARTPAAKLRHLRAIQDLYRVADARVRAWEKAEAIFAEWRAPRG